jgi:Tol biopolymer transport system component
MSATTRKGVLLVAALWAFAGVASAQYFGQNKVRFKDMDFRVLHTAHFDIHYYPEERDAVKMAAQMAERWYTRYSSILQYELPAGQPVIMYDSQPAFRATTVIPGEIGVGTGGVTEGLKRRVVLPFAGSLAETDHVLGHELVHAYQYAMTSGKGDTAAGGEPGAATLPLWFIEGMAEYLSLGPVDPNTSMWLRDAVARKKLPSFKDLDNPEYFPYRFGQAFWSYVCGTYGDKVIGKMMRAAGRAHSVESAIQSVLGLQPDLLIEQWHKALADAYGPVLARTRPAANQAHAVVAAKEGEDSLNVSPVLSPDGTKMVMFSHRGLFSVDLYLVDVETGEPVKRLTKAAVDPHLGSMEFIQSAGCWRPDGSQFAFATVSGGWPHLVVYDFRQGEVSRDLDLRPLGEIFSPTWPPDGKQIAFSAITGGFTDLYVFDLDSQKLRRLTRDAYADLQPAWSPSGRYLAFVTDRFGTNLADLSYGEYRLALLDVQDGLISALPGFPTGKHIDPHWGNSDETLYFISDHDGISNVYLLDRRADAITPLTDVQTGVTGIANLSPAISVARQAERLAFSSFQDGMYSVYAVDTGRPEERKTELSYKSVATLPPSQRTSDEIGEALQRPKAGLPRPSSFETTDYHPRLSLNYFAPPTISAGVGTYGALIGGGTALYWSDLLEQHQLMTSFQTMATSSGNILRNIGAVAAYQNQQSRWTWGLTGGQVPYLSGSYGSAVASVNSVPVLLEQQTTFWQLERQAKGVFSYPFNRAMRVEFTGGYENIGFAAETETVASLLSTGQVIGSQKTSVPMPDALNFGTASAALVYDTSVFGGTSPAWGRRFRFEAGTQAGSINLTTALADYRQYFLLPKNLTFAVRALHYGRYGGGAEDSRLQDLYLGYPSLVRGYTVNSFTAADCGASLAQNGTCPAFDRLLGSRIAVANAELRIPILGTLGLVPSRGVPPMELAPFFDAGIAWRTTERGTFGTESRSPARSYGTSLRVNVLGFFVAQLSCVRPMDRPTGWRWEFSVVPGF